MSAFARVATPAGPRFARADGDGWLLLRDAPWVSREETGERVLSPTLLAAVTPSKIICVGRNYAAHAKELGHDLPKEPLLFFKPPSAVIGPGDAIVLPPESERVDHEAELGVVIGERCRDVARERAGAVIFGYTCVNDVTARDLQKKDGQWARAKGFDTFCPVGPRIVTKIDPQRLRVVCRVDDETRQDGETRDMIFPVADLVAYISRIFTLLPGDLIVTGTPEGVGALRPGAAVTVEIEGIGALSNPVRSA
ncbi:MAG: fumarylacetoacetate hydrolase family protein [Polyangiaceae bacterium]|nr:fumarylacetoacetate hydrolase family protein [Polyangiaceae bacterium]